MFFKPQWGVAFIGLLFAVGCSTSPANQAIAQIENVAIDNDYHRLALATEQFQLASFQPNSFQPGQPLRVYIAGDGRSWITRYRASLNPTPRQPLGFKLAIQDKQNSVYLGRPCQFFITNSQTNCEVRYWTLARYSEAVIVSMNQALDQLVAKYLPSQLQLIGYSGGGTVALLLAARREDVAGVITVAGNLSSVAFSQHHRVSLLTDSLDPVNYSAQLQNVPQLHFVGGDDEVVPLTIAQHYQRAFSQLNCIQVREIAGVTHGQGWLASWPSLQQIQPRCD